MKITDAKTTPSLGKENHDWSLLKIETGDGIEDLGEWVAGASVKRLRQILLGKDPLNVNQRHHDHLWGVQGRGAGVEIDEEIWEGKGEIRDQRQTADGLRGRVLHSLLFVGLDTRTKEDLCKSGEDELEHWEIKQLGNFRLSPLFGGFENRRRGRGDVDLMTVDRMSEDEASGVEVIPDVAGKWRALSRDREGGRATNYV